MNIDNIIDSTYSVKDIKEKVKHNPLNLVFGLSLGNAIGVASGDTGLIALGIAFYYLDMPFEVHKEYHFNR